MEGKKLELLKTKATQLYGYDIEAVRADFPILHQEHHAGVPLVYLDNATQGADGGANMKPTRRTSL